MGQLEQRQRREQPSSGCALRPEAGVKVLRRRSRASTWTLTPGQELASTARDEDRIPGVGRCQPKTRQGRRDLQCGGTPPAVLRKLDVRRKD